MTLEEVKKEVKKEFSRRKKTEPDLKLGNVYNDFSRRLGHKDWNTYRTFLTQEAL